MIIGTHNPDKIPPPDDVIKDFIREVKRTEAFTNDEVEWVEGVLSRGDTADGYQQLVRPFIFDRNDQGENLYACCKAFNLTKKKLTPVELFEAQSVLRRLVWGKRASMYRQKKVIVACPQRKQHKVHAVPNLHNWEGAGQHVSTQMLAVYGLDYVQARTQCVKQALSDPDATHILFVDDDLLLPKTFAQVLIDAQLPSVAGIYVKKSPALQTNTTTSRPDRDFAFNQHLVEPEQGKLEPVPVTCCGGGMWLLDLRLFRKLPEPWFEMLGGPDGSVRIGEDSLLVQRLANAMLVTTYVIPGLVGVHCDFNTGDQWGPEWLVDPQTRRLRPEFVHAYQQWPADLDLRELCAPDVKDYFGKNTREGSPQNMKAAV